MKIFIDDVPVYLVPMEQTIDREHYDLIIDASKEKVRFDELIDDVLIRKADISLIMDFYNFQCQDNNKRLDSLTFKVHNYDEVVKAFKKEFKIVKAAGGIVTKSNKILFIYRLKKWDLPKGKLEKKEDFEVAAVREVEEECNVKVILGKHICKTWHTYTRNGKNHLKKTMWYKMSLLSDSKMKPQKSEGIEKLIWVGKDEMRAVLLKTYRSIRYVMKKFHEHEESLV
ncbi:NUDIX domain-containing protein [Marivirga atlantica]|jgi:8-oxo-dGTP pyrophosphatase MutT (NUDIX family)|uniref:NUDIX domain-containing protein n=1 Tax=Marivirga atlantica TaxID=1548457 RepID=A0A937A7Y5_9BACT|nr:NUDIX domain-containing protein [Marivirga atlantica]MBL0765412.1 NUDIX domain-containing protein [Marivirga atlantica]